MKKILIFPILLTFNLLFSQDSYRAEISSGFIMMDKFHHEFDSKNIFRADFIQTQITIWKEFDFNRRFNVSFGGGYTHFFLVHENFNGVHDDHQHCIHARMNVNHQLFLKNLFLTMGSTFYYRTKEIDQLDFPRQYFSNLDLGLSYKYKDNFLLSITSPISIIPMYYIHSVNTDVIEFQPYVVWGETTGFNLGLSYTFYQNRKK